MIYQVLHCMDSVPVVAFHVLLFELPRFFLDPASQAFSIFVISVAKVLGRPLLLPRQAPANFHHLIPTLNLIRLSLHAVNLSHHPSFNHQSLFRFRLHLVINLIAWLNCSVCLCQVAFHFLQHIVYLIVGFALSNWLQCQLNQYLVLPLNGIPAFALQASCFIRIIYNSFQ